MPSEYPWEPNWYIVFNIIMIVILAILAATLVLPTIAIGPSVP
ncbi:MAG: hypothetical protein ACLQF1_11595 [Methyloceanibacter sp.]